MKKPKDDLITSFWGETLFEKEHRAVKRRVKLQKKRRPKSK